MFGRQDGTPFPSGGDLGLMPPTPDRARRAGRFILRAGVLAVFAAALFVALPRFVADPPTSPVLQRAQAEDVGSSAPAKLAQTAPPQVAPQLTAPVASDAWVKMPKMKLEAVYGGPLRDTVIQRWRDPVDGSVCYLYLPINAPTTAVQPSGFVQYGASTIGSVSCFATSVAPTQQVAVKPVQPSAVPPASPPSKTAPAPIKP